MATYRKATDAEKRMCQAVLDDAKAGNAAKAAAQLLIDGDLPIEEGRTAGDAIRSSIESNLSERAATIAMSTGCSEDDARKAARTPDFGSTDNWDVPEAVSSFDSNPSSFDGAAAATPESDKTATGTAPIDQVTYEMAKGADIEKFEKGEYQVSIRKVKMGTECYNKLEDAHYVTDRKRCYIVTGTCGEEWPIDAAKVRSKYGIDPYSLRWENPPTKVTVKGGGSEIYAFRADGQHDVQTSWGDTLKTNRDGVGHGKGDMIVSDTPDFSGDVWVVNGEAFDTTYAPVGTAARVEKERAAERKREEERMAAEIKRNEEERKAAREKYERQVREEHERNLAAQRRQAERIRNDPHSEYARPSVAEWAFYIGDEPNEKLSRELMDKAIDKWKDEHGGDEPDSLTRIPIYEPVVAFHDDTWIFHDALNAKDYEWNKTRVEGLSGVIMIDKDEALDKSFDFITDPANEEKIVYGAPYTARDGSTKRYDRKNHETMIYVGGYTRMRFGKAEQVGGYWKSTGKWYD